MKKYLYIGIGGFAGAILRYGVRLIETGWIGRLPVTTLTVNILGCFLIGMVLSLTGRSSKLNANLQLGIAVGFLGALTTFSTVCRELVDLARQGQILTALVYGAISIFLGLAAVYGGAGLTSRMTEGFGRSSGTFAETTGGEGEES